MILYAIYYVLVCVVFVSSIPLLYRIIPTSQRLHYDYGNEEWINVYSDKDFSSWNDSIYYIEVDIILNSKRVVLPHNSRIIFNGGVIRGGELVGNNSTVDNLTDLPCFDNVVLSGSWVNKKASSSLFTFDLVELRMIL